MKKILTIIFALLGLCAIGASVSSTEIGNLHDYHNVVTNVDLTGLATSEDIETVKTNAIVKNADNVVDIGFSIKQSSGNGDDISLRFGSNDPSGPSIVMNRLYSTAPSSYFENSIVFIPTPDNEESLLSRIMEYSSAGKNASNEVVSIVSSAVDPVKKTVNEVKSTATNALKKAETAKTVADKAKETATEANNTATAAKNNADSAAIEAASAQSMARGAQAAADAAANQSSGALGAISLINEKIDTKITPAISSNAEKINTVSQILEGKNFRITVSNITERLALATFEVATTNGWHEIWNETNAIEEAKIEIQNDIKSNYYTKTQNDNITKETRKWSRFDSESGEAAPDGFTQISSKNGIILGADLGYLNVQGSDYWVLSGNGNINVTTNGMISICDSSGEAVFRSVKGDAQLKGAIPGSFSVQKNVNGKDIITIGYLFTASVKPPRMEFSNSLEPGEVNWIKDTDEGAPFTAVWDGATCTVTLDADSKGFFRAFYWLGGESYVESTQPMSVVDLRIGGKKVGSTTINGKTVLILEDQ